MTRLTRDRQDFLEVAVASGGDTPPEAVRVSQEARVVGHRPEEPMSVLHRGSQRGLQV